MTDHTETQDEHDHTKQRHGRRGPIPPHGALPSGATPSVPLYADPDWIAANFPSLVLRAVEDLVQSGAAADEAVEAVLEAVVQLYARRRPELSTRRAIAKFLRLVAFRAVRKERRRRARLVALQEGVNDVAADTEPEPVLEHRARLAATVQALRAMPIAESRPLVQILRKELVAMGYGTAEHLAAETGRRSDAERMQLYRARLRLRERMREWLAGIPLTRAVVRREFADPGGWPAAIGAACVASIVALSLSNVSASPSPSGGSSDFVQSTGSTLGRPAFTNDLRPAEQLSVPRARPAPAQSDRPTDDAGRHGLPRLETPIGAHRGTALAVPGTRHAVDNHDRPPGDDSLVCLRRTRIIGDTCIPHPLLRDPATVVDAVSAP